MTNDLFTVARWLCKSLRRNRTHRCKSHCGCEEAPGWCHHQFPPCLSNSLRFAPRACKPSGTAKQECTHLLAVLLQLPSNHSWSERLHFSEGGHSACRKISRVLRDERRRGSTGSERIGGIAVDQHLGCSAIKENHDLARAESRFAQACRGDAACEPRFDPLLVYGS